MWRAFCTVCNHPVWRWHRHTDIYPPAEETWIVQLVAVDDTGHVVTTWEPIEVQGEDAAYKQAAELRRDNKWGSAGRWPHVNVWPDVDGGDA